LPGQTTLSDLIELHRAGNLETAEAGYRRVIEESGDPNAMQLLATLLQQKHRYREALSWMDRALRHLGRNDSLLSNRAAILLGLGKSGEALAATEDILTRNPQHAGARRNRLLALAALAEATPDPALRLQWYQRYLEAGGAEARTWLGYANTLQRLGRAADAAGAMQRAVELDPEAAPLASAALISRHFLMEETTQTLCGTARRIGASFFDPVERPRRPGNPDIWGFYSPRFGDGPVASLVLPVLEALRQQGIRIVLLSGYRHAAAAGAAFRDVADRWLDVGDLDDDALAQAVAAENIGVLFDLCGHAPGNRLAAFAGRLAPLQVSWGDWFLSSGLPRMDLFLGDAVLTPPREHRFFSESVHLLPHRFSYSSPPQRPRPAAHPPEPPVFASLNRPAKLTDATVDCWSAILRAVPDARLLLRGEDFAHEAFRRHTGARFEARGVAPQRLDLRPFAAYAEALQDYRMVSVALDPFPFTGCVTSFDALAMGVPLVSLRGQTPVARQGAAILTSLDLPEWIAQSTGSYVSIAAELARPENNRRARRRLADIMHHPALDCGRFARDLVAAVRQAGGR